MNKSIIILIFYIFSVSSFAQSTVKEFDIYFSSNSSSLNQNEHKKLKNKFDELTNLIKAYEVEISGYTDSTGDKEKNKVLSEKRAKSVANYMIGRGLPSKQITTNYFGSDNPLASNKTMEGKAVNRRTHVRITTKNYIPKSIAGYEHKPTEYNFNCAQGTQIETSSGSKFNIPKDAFVDSEGKIVEGNVKVEIVEYRDPLDFVFANEPMNLEQDGKIAFFQSDGMFKIEAKQGEEDLSLAPGKKIETEFSLIENQDDSRFYAFDAQTGNWDNGNSINQTSLTLGHDNQFENSSRCREALATKTINTEFNAGNMIVPAYKSGLIKTKDILFSELNSKKNDGYKELKSAEREVRSLESAIRYNTRFYRLKRVETSLGRTYFEVRPKRKKWYNKNNEAKTLKKTLLSADKKQLRTNDKRPAFRGSTEIKNVELLERGKGYTLTYQARYIDRRKKGKPYVVVKDSITGVRLTKAGWLTFLNSQSGHKRAYRNYKTKKAYYDSIADLRVSKVETERVKHDSIYDFVLCVEDTLKSRKLLKNVKKFTAFGQRNNLTTSDKEDWLNEFDVQQRQLNEIIDSLLVKPEYANCSFTNPAFMEEQGRQNEVKGILAKSGLSASLTSLGTYNADAIKQLVKPDMIFAKYKDEAGETLDITVIYVFDETLNGVMRFDGYMDRSPYKFEISKKNAKALIAFDDDMNAYMIPKDDFKKTIKGKKVTFKLKSFAASENKEEIAAQIQI